MDFQSELKRIMTKLNCTNKDVSTASGLSESVVSRYRNGVRVPRSDSEKLNMLVSGLAKIAEEKKISLDEEEILKSLSQETSSFESEKLTLFAENTKKLLSALGITIKELSIGIGYDPTYLSRILRGERNPKKIEKIVTLISTYFAKYAIEKNQIQAVAELIGSVESISDNEDELQQMIGFFILPKYDKVTSEHRSSASRMDSFLQKLDEFDLDDYIRAIHFDDIKLPTVPFQIPKSQQYSGIEEFKASEIDFMKTVVLSKSKGDVILYSDMPITEMAKDGDFSKKYMFGLAMMIKKGLHIDFIHDVNRPWNEMMIGLEGNIPLYMTGQISPFYLKNPESHVFRNLIKVSGSAALVGEAVSNHHDEGRYYLTTKKEDVHYYRARAAAVLKQARPLMDIYSAEKNSEFLEYLSKSYDIQGNRKMIFSSLPLFTMSEELLGKMLSENNIDKETAKRIIEFSRERREKIQQMSMRERIDLVVPQFSEGLFEKEPPVLSVSELFLNRCLRYTYEIYSAHLEQTREFTLSLNVCTLEISEKLTFKNIDITIIKGKEVLVSKAKSPTIHFVIKHPRMVKLFENYSVPIIL